MNTKKNKQTKKTRTIPIEGKRRIRQKFSLKKRQAYSKFLAETPFSSLTTEEHKLAEFKKWLKLKKEIEKKLKNKEKRLKYLNRKKRRLTDSHTNEETTDQPYEKKFKSDLDITDTEFDKRFYENSFGIACSICDRLWFKNDLKNIPKCSINLLTQIFPGEKLDDFQSCETCYKSLLSKKIPRLSKSNGFKYPDYPNGLSPLDVVSERLVSPRIPFMQIRRLRHVNGAKGIVGQVINVPVDVNEMVNELPRQLNDDFAFNVNIKRHLIHKSTYLSGVVKKSTVKEWLNYLVQKPLYKLYNVKINDSFMKNEEDLEHRDKTSTSEEVAIIESICPERESDRDLLIGKQHTLMWSEEKYLDIAPGMHKKPMSLIFDEHAEELSFPSIYLGEAREFKIDNVTPFMMATSEVRRKDRRGVKPEHVLYMAMKLMRLRVTEGLYVTFMNMGDTINITRADSEDEKFLIKCRENNLSFLKSIPNSVHYWMTRKKDLFAMIRQLGKPTSFLTLSATEYNCSQLLKLLYKLSEGTDFIGSNPAIELNSHIRTNLVNDDPVICCLYFNKLVDTIMFLLQSYKFTPFKKYRVLDFFKRVEFQQRGSAHFHILLWLDNDPKEIVSEVMPETIKLIDSLCTVNADEDEEVKKNQTHKHTFTCTKNSNTNSTGCRFNAPFWPVNETIILIPMPKEDRRKDALKQKFSEMHNSLEFCEFNNLDEFLSHHEIKSYENYLNVLRSGITRPKIFLKRTIAQKWINSFNPWIASKLQSNMDIQFILEPYSCAAYVVEYVNKTNRGISSLHRDIIKLRDEYPDKDYSELLKELGIKMLNAVEMSSQEAAWYLLNLHMSESSRQIAIIPTSWPHERQRVRKTHKQMEEEMLNGCAKNIWKEGVIEKYEARPENLNDISLAQFVAWFYKSKKGNYCRRSTPKIIRYRNYEMKDINDYKREMVLLHVPFKTEAVDILDRNAFLKIYAEKEKEIIKSREEFEDDINMDKIIAYCKDMCENEDETGMELDYKNEQFAKSKEISQEFVESIRQNNNDDIQLTNVEKICSVVRKRTNVMSSEEYCAEMRKTNKEQRDLILEVISRIFQSEEEKPLQIFLTGPAGCGKTFTIKLLMETYNRFCETHNSIFNSYVVAASTGMAAAALDGTTVHSLFRINNSKKESYLPIETLNSFRTAFKHAQVVFIEECSMIGSFLIHQLHCRLQHILCNHNVPFGGINMILCGDLRQLPPVCQTPIYKRSKNHFCSEIVWQSLEYYPLIQVVRQSDTYFSNILTKIGNGESLTNEEKKSIESRFVPTKYVDIHYPTAIRLFFKTVDVDNYNNNILSNEKVIEHVAKDVYSGYKNNEQLASARSKVHKMKVDETGNMPYILKLLPGNPYMIRVNIDVLDRLVNGVIGKLEYIENDSSGKINRIWMSFNDPKIGALQRLKYDAHIKSNSKIHRDWVPIGMRVATITLNSKIISCKRTQFPVVPGNSITAHKSQGGTYPVIIYEYDKSHEQQLVYVALSRVTAFEGLFLTHKSGDHNFYHAAGNKNEDLQKEFERLNRHKLTTIGETCREFLEKANSCDIELTLCTLNVQSLKAHKDDILTDSVLNNVKILALTETWIEDEKQIQLAGYNLISQKKRDYVKSGGVAIYENQKKSKIMQCKKHTLVKTHTTKNEELTNNECGDICAVETRINNQTCLLITLYISSGTNALKIVEFLEKNLENLKQNKQDQIILCGDFNIHFNEPEGQKVISFLQNTYSFEMNNNPNTSTTRNKTCIDAIFTKNINTLQTTAYISYFTYHKPLLSITNHD